MSKIYVVTSGCYSGYAIVSMHTVKEKAESVVKEYNDDQRARILKYHGDWLKTEKARDKYLEDYGYRVEVWDVDVKDGRKV